MKAAGKAALAIGIIGGVAVAGPYVIGLRIESGFRAGIASLSEQSPYPIRISRYERGLYSAEAETTIEIALPPDEDEAPKILLLRLQHAISHGPRPDGPLRAGHAVTTARFDDAPKIPVTALFGEHPAFTLTTDISYLGGISGSLGSPAVNVITPGDDEAPEALTAQWSGVEAHYSFRNGHFVGRLEAPALHMSEADESVVDIGPTLLTADMQQIDPGRLWVGSSAMTVDSIAVNVDDGRVVIKQIAVDSSSEITDGQMSAVIKMSIADIEAAGGFDKLRLDIAFDHFDAAGIADLSRALNRVQQAHGRDGAAADPAVLITELKPALGRVAAAHPEFRIDEFSFNGPGGAVTAKGGIRYVGDANLDNLAPITDIEAEGQFDAPLADIDQLLRKKVHSDLASNAGVAPNEVPQEVIASALQNTRDAMIAQGLLLVDGQQAKSVMTFKGGVLTINGKTLGAGVPGS